MLKTGADCRALEEYFDELKETYDGDEDAGFESPLDALRNLVPALGKISSKGMPFAIDPALDLRKQHEVEWNKHYEEGKKKIEHFNHRLARAIKEKTDRGSFLYYIFRRSCALILFR